MRLGVVAPLDSRTTGVADYVWDLLPYLSQAAGEPIVVFGEGEGRRCPEGNHSWVSRSIAALPRLARQLDLLIYHMGNSPAHDFMAQFLLDYPGLVVLHDLTLCHFYVRGVR